MLESVSLYDNTKKSMQIVIYIGKITLLRTKCNGIMEASWEGTVCWCWSAFMNKHIDIHNLIYSQTLINTIRPAVSYLFNSLFWHLVKFKTDYLCIVVKNTEYLLKLQSTCYILFPLYSINFPKCTVIHCGTKKTYHLDFPASN